MIFTYPVHRQRLPARPRAISSRDGEGFFDSIASDFITIPGEQNPHCEAPAATKACAHCSRRSAGSPSSEVTCFPSTCVAFWAQLTTAFPSTRTVHAPHEPSGAHPSFIEVSPRRWRSTSSSVSSSSTSSEVGSSFSVNAIALIGTSR